MVKPRPSTNPASTNSPSTPRSHLSSTLRSQPRPARPSTKAESKKAGSKKAESKKAGSKAIPVSQQPRLRRRSWKTTVGTIVMVLAAAGLVGGSGWLAVQMIVAPQTLLWINRFFPGWVPNATNGLKPPQTLTEVRREVQQAGQRLGESIVLGSNVSFGDGKTPVTDTLLPVFAQQPNCQAAVCERIVELRLYQSSNALAPNQREPYFELVSQIAIDSPTEASVLEPLVNARSASQGTDRAMPLTQLARFDGKVPAQGVWLNLQGQWERGDDRISYGQVIHYNPARFHLGVLLNWTSPPGKEPQWQEVTGGGPAELVVDQTIGMEPQFQVYQVQPRNQGDDPLQLSAIDLQDAPIDHPTYTTALLLAQSGLWFPAWDVLRSFKATTDKWPAQAQAQLDLIHWHAQATQAQADKTWASPGQQVLANLVDGRWKPGLLALESSPDTAEAVALLKTDRGRLQQRVEAALKVSPQQWEPRVWKVLLLAVQKNRLTAIVWLKQQPKATPADLVRANRLIDRLGVPFEAAPIASPITSPTR